MRLDPGEPNRLDRDLDGFFQRARRDDEGDAHVRGVAMRLDRAALGSDGLRDLGAPSNAVIEVATDIAMIATARSRHP